MKLRKNLMKIFKVFFGSVFEVKDAICWEKKNKVRDFYLLGLYPLVGRHVVKHGKNLKLEIYVAGKI